MFSSPFKCTQVHQVAFSKKTLAIQKTKNYIASSNKHHYVIKIFLSMEQTNASKVRLHKHPLWVRLNSIRANKLPYPVVYEDGLISSRMRDVIRRTGGKNAPAPYGFLFKGYIIKFNPSQQKFSHPEAKKYCQNYTFAGKTGTLPTSELMRHIVQNNGKIRYILDIVAASYISNGFYWTSDSAGPAGQDLQYYAWHFTYTLPQGPSILLGEEDGKALVVFKAS